MAKTEKPKATHTLTARQLDVLASALRAKRDEIHSRRLAATDDRVLEVQSDPMDEASEVTSEAEAAGVAQVDARILREVEEALTRMAEGTYGVSAESGAPIPYERLLAVPWALRTAQEEEQRAARAR
jgi:DnaK suppressor protein